MVNIFTKMPDVGDAVVGNTTTGKVLFITADSFSKADLSSDYEMIGVVYKRRGKQVKIVYKENASKLWCAYGYHILSGYTLDGTDRTGVISARFASNSWASNIDKTISYNATSVADLVSQLNAAFAADTDFTAQSWSAWADGDNVVVNYNNSDYRQFGYNSAKSGFSLTSALPNTTAHANMTRKHGGTGGGEGAISSWYRALAYFRNDNSSASYNPNTDVTSIKRVYPVCLPGYLGTSSYQTDHCKLLRDTYGEGEEGWLKFMASCMPVKPSDYGDMGVRNGLARTKALLEYQKADGTKCSPAAEYCYGKGATCLPSGNWYLPTIEDLSDLLEGIKYGTDSSRTADAVNATLYKMGASAISNGSVLWSCCRYNTNYAWYASGGSGFFGNYGMYGSFLCVPVSLYELA